MITKRPNSGPRAARCKAEPSTPFSCRCSFAASWPAAATDSRSKSHSHCPAAHPLCHEGAHRQPCHLPPRFPQRVQPAQTLRCGPTRGDSGAGRGRAGRGNCACSGGSPAGRETMQATGTRQTWRLGGESEPASLKDLPRLKISRPDEHASRRGWCVSQRLGFLKGCGMGSGGPRLNRRATSVPAGTEKEQVRNTQDSTPRAVIEGRACFSVLRKAPRVLG